jgi:hypothetical protein
MDLLLVAFVAAMPIELDQRLSRYQIEARAAFQRVPSLKPVKSADASDPVEPLKLSDAKNDDEKSCVFPSSAYFPQPAFTANGQLLEQDPAIIYEGMRVVHRKDGTYAVHFTVTRPNTVVRLRLQLTAISTDGTVQAILTLPVINLRPATDDLSDPGTRTYHVLHEGYSERIREIWQHPGGCPNLIFTRSGTARFGTTPESSIR